MKANSGILKLAGAMLISALTLLCACKKDSSSPSSGSTSTSTTSASSLSANGAASDNMFDDALNVTMETSQDNSINAIVLQKTGTEVNGTGSSGTGAYYCGTVTVSPADTTTFPKTVTVDFGSGCTSGDSITRSGSITYTLSERFSTPGASISATFSNYVVNGYKLTGTYAITNNSSVAAGIVYTTTVTGGSITFPSDTSYSFAGTKTVTQTAGAGTLDFSAYVFSITGSYTISNSYGETLTATVTTPLVKQETCRNIVSGLLAFTYGKGNIKLNGTFDYGDGACDKTATITIGTTINTITLP